MAKTTPPVLDLTNYQRQGNLAVDMCANCIIHERKFGLNPKAIIIDLTYFEMFRAWVRDNYGEEVAETKAYYIDGVEIRQERIISNKSLLIEYESTATA